MTERRPEVSIVIPTYNRVVRLRRVLAGLAGQTHQDFETVVVSDGSTDGTRNYLASDEPPLPVVACHQDNQGPAAARNLGVRTATGKLVLFIDDDVVPTPTLVEAHVAAHRRLGPNCVVIGPMLSPSDHEMTIWVAWEQDMLAKQYRSMREGEWAPTKRQFYTGNASVERAHVIEVGGFDTTFRRAEDVELAYRLADIGLEFAFEPDAVGLHYAERSYESWLATGRAYGHNDVVFARDCDRPWILEVALREYGLRRLPIRSIARLSIGRPRTVDVVNRTLLAVAERANARQHAGIVRGALSGIWNLAYYDGMAIELGGRREFYRARRSAARRSAAQAPASDRTAG